jgi:putative endonuclease
MANRSLTHYPDLGGLGEDLVAQWLQSTGWTILHRRWRSRQGEIDIIAHLNPRSPHSTLAFVEVKTRSRGNWDAGGLLAVTPQKQLKLWRSAEHFLATHPHLAASPCRFDVALVYCERPSPRQRQKTTETLDSLETPTGPLPPTFQLGQSVFLGGHQMILESYISAAFDIG